MLDRNMTFGNLFFSTKGRIRRSTYWIGALAVIVPIYVGLILDFVIGSPGIFTILFSLLTIWPEIAVGVKRCHDRNRSGWFLLIALVPIVGSIWIFIDLGLLKGASGGNRFGPDPSSSKGTSGTKAPPL